MAGAADFVAPRPLAVTVGNYLLMYADGRFARHPRFRYFVLNTEMRWRALQAGRIYVRQHPHDTHMMPSSFSSIVLTWLIFISTIIVLQSQALRRNVYIGMFAQARPPNALHSSSYSESSDLQPESTASKPAVVSLLDRLRAPRMYELTRVANVRQLMVLSLPRNYVLAQTFVAMLVRLCCS